MSKKFSDESLQAYRSGDLLVALAKYPAGRQPGSDAERVYYAGLLLAVGQVEPAESVLASLSAADASSPTATGCRGPAPAHRRREAAAESDRGSVRNWRRNSWRIPTTNNRAPSPEVSLPAALDSARQAVTNSPEFGFGWERVAELEFSFGRTRPCA